MSKFSEFEVAHGGSDRLYYMHSEFPMGTYATAYTFKLVTWKYGRLPIVFSNCDFERCVFDRVDLRFVVFLDCKFDQCVFKDCQLDMSVFVDCSGHALAFRRCSATDMLIMHGMFDGASYSFSKMQDTRITVNTEYLAPMVFFKCDLEGANIANVAHMQYHGMFGKPAIAKDRVSVKMDKCLGNYGLEGFQYVAT